MNLQDLNLDIQKRQEDLSNGAMKIIGNDSCNIQSCLHAYVNRSSQVNPIPLRKSLGHHRWL